MKLKKAAPAGSKNKSGDNSEKNKNALKGLRQSQPLRVEDSELSWFSTSRCLHSKLWLVNNKKLEESFLGSLAKYQEKYAVTLYAFVIMGNHTHDVAKFSKRNRAAFKRDCNARFADAIKGNNPEHPGGPVFERRYSCEALPAEEDIEDRFFYCALRGVSAGLVEHIEDYPGYNSFDDAIHLVS